MERQTIQKTAILEVLKNDKTHPSAEQVYSKIKKKMPQISKGTVYRVLNSLEEKKIIQKLFFDVSRYDGDDSIHAHFKCTSCGNVYDIIESCRNCAVLKNKKTKVGKIKYYQVYFYGECKKCSKPNK